MPSRPGSRVGEGALRILLVGQAANVATGSVGFILIMTGFTGLDLLDNALGVALLAGLAAALTLAFGIEGTATAAAVSIAAVNVVRLGAGPASGRHPALRSLVPRAFSRRRGGDARGVRRPRRPRGQPVVGVARRHGTVAVSPATAPCFRFVLPEQRASGDRHVARANRRTAIAGRAAAVP